MLYTILLLLLILVLLGGGGIGYTHPASLPSYGGGVLGIIAIVLLVLYLTGRLR